MKRVTFTLIGVLLICCLVVLAASAVIVHQETADLHSEEMTGRTYLTSDEEMVSMQLDFRDAVKAKAEFPGGLSLEAEETASVSLLLKNPGEYSIVAVYAAPEMNLFENPVDFTIGAYKFTSTLSFLWADDIEQIKTDRYGNEVLPEQYQLPYAASYLRSTNHFPGSRCPSTCLPGMLRSLSGRRTRG